MSKYLSAAEAVIARHGADREELVQILLDIQKEIRWLPGEVIDLVARRLAVPLSYVYRVATFYAHFSLHPRGRHSVCVCVGTACHVRGAPKLLDRVQTELGVKPGQTTSDEKFSLTTANCLGCCALGPVLVADGEYKSNPDTAELKAFIQSSE